MKETLLTWLFEQAKRHGATFVILSIALYWVVQRLDAMDKKYENAVQTQINYLTEDRDKMQKVIENNTAVMERVVNALEKK